MQATLAERLLNSMVNTTNKTNHTATVQMQEQLIDGGLRVSVLYGVFGLRVNAKYSSKKGNSKNVTVVTEFPSKICAWIEVAQVSFEDGTKSVLVRRLPDQGSFN